MGAGLVLPPSPTRHRRPRGPQETVEAAPESSRRALQMSNLARPTGRSPKEVMSDRAKRVAKARATYVALDGLGDKCEERGECVVWVLICLFIDHTNLVYSKSQQCSRDGRSTVEISTS